MMVTSKGIQGWNEKMPISAGRQDWNRRNEGLEKEVHQGHDTGLEREKADQVPDKGLKQAEAYQCQDTWKEQEEAYQCRDKRLE